MELLTRDEILALPRIYAGMLRHSIVNDDGSVESTAINNLMVGQAEFCCDFAGNRFGCYMVVPTFFWNHVRNEWGSIHGRDWHLLPKNKYGGYMGVFRETTIYVGNTDVIVIKPDVGELVYEFEIGPRHEIVISKSQLIDQLGYEAVGFDKRLVYVPWWEGEGRAYPPPGVLLEWVRQDGYKPAVAILENPPESALKEWAAQGYITAPTKLALLEMGRQTEFLEGEFREVASSE